MTQHAIKKQIINIKDKFKNRLNLELNQAKVRLILCVFTVSWFSVLSFLNKLVVSKTLAISMAIFVILSIVITIHICLNERWKTERLFLMIVCDAFLTGLLVSQSDYYGSPLLLFFFIPPIGNALRFGKKFFLPSATIMFISLTYSLYVNEYYHTNELFILGMLLLFLVIVIKINFTINKLDYLKNKLSNMAMHDNLTGLPNRRLLSSHLEQFIIDSHRKKVPVACIFIDLDGFKAVNDKYGHGIGDKLIIKVAHLLLNSIDKDSVVARLGGDEFVIASPNGKDSLLDLAKKIISSLENMKTLQDNPIDISASIGIIYSQRSDDAESLLNKADAAMYEAKNTGKRKIIEKRDLNF